MSEHNKPVMLCDPRLHEAGLGRTLAFPSGFGVRADWVGKGLLSKHTDPAAAVPTLPGVPAPQRPALAPGRLAGRMRRRYETREGRLGYFPSRQRK